MNNILNLMVAYVHIAVPLLSLVFGLIFLIIRTIFMRYRASN